jgi:hypothetical protein
MFPDYPTASEAKISESNILAYGNINLRTRPLSLLVNGKVDANFCFLHYTVFSDGTPIFALIPQVTDDGLKLNQKQAIDLFEISGRHFGKFAFKVAGKPPVHPARLYQNVLTAKELAILKARKATGIVGGDSYFPVSLNPDAEKRNLGGILQVTDLFGEAQRYFEENLFEVTVDYKMDIGSEVAFKVMDNGYKMMDNNYFVIRRDITYRGRNYEIAAVSAGPAEGGSPVITVSARNKGIQQMKRDKLPRTISGGSAYEYAAAAAKKFGMGFIGQKTNTVHSTFKSGGSNNNKSTWDVLRDHAQGNQYVVFEIDNILVFGSHQWLMWKFGNWLKGDKRFVPLIYVPGFSGEDLARELIDEDTPSNVFELEKWHTFSTDDADPMAATGSCTVLMPNGGALRPGMTAICGPYPDYFYGGYIITDVNYTEGSPGPASVTFRTPEEPKNQKGLPIKPRTGSKPAIPIPVGNTSVVTG